MNIFNAIVFGTCIIFILTLLAILYLMNNAQKYYEKKLADMNDCYGYPCDQCEKYKISCKGRKQWLIQ